jgi:hypothetical protein
MGVDRESLTRGFGSQLTRVAGGDKKRFEYEDLCSKKSTGVYRRFVNVGYFLAALTLAHRAVCAAAIRLRPAADIVRFFPAASNSWLRKEQTGRHLTGTSLHLSISPRIRCR